MRKKKGLLAIFGLLFCTIIIYSYMQENEKEIEFGEMLFGVPTYQNSRLSRPMSSLRANPYTAVFLTNDSFGKVVAYYKEKLPDAEYNELTYGGTTRGMTVYQFKLEDGILTNQINKGVEIIPYNSFNQRVFKAKTKIKIFIPLSEVMEEEEKESEISR